MRALTAGVMVALALLLAGCTAPATVPAGPAPPTEAAPVYVGLDPAEVEIPAIGARSSLVGLGLTPDGSWAEPDVNAPEQASWFTGGPAPGAAGPAVILGHVNGGGRPGVFARLGELQVGADVVVRGRDDRSVTFRVVRTQQVAKAAFPTADVLAPTAVPELRLITCGGEFDRATGHYVDSLIVWAMAVSVA